MISSDFSHIMLNHELDELLEGGGHRIPTKFILSLGWIAPEIHHIGRTIEIFRYGYNDLAYKKFRARYYNTFLINAFTFPTKFYTSVMESESSKVCCTPVAITKSSGLSCWRISHIHST